MRWSHGEYIYLHPNEIGLLSDIWNVVKNRQCYKSSGCFVCCAAAKVDNLARQTIKWKRHNGIQLVDKRCKIIFY